jgi:hypothetical protein
MIFAAAALACGQEAWDIARTTLGGKKVEIEYGRPTLKGRTLADLMKQLPADRIWRAGSGAMTILTTEADLVIGGRKVPAGNYSLYMYCPETGPYALILNADIGEPLGGILPKAAPDRANRSYPHFMDYQDIANREVARIPLKQVSAPRSEVLIYSFEPDAGGALLTIRWGDEAWTVQLQRTR